jgi:hypothetical protein
MQYGSTMETNCIWCVDSPTANSTFNSREHVFPRALGGSVTFRDREVCDEHNSALSVFETELAKEGVEAFARVAFGPSGRSEKQLRKAEAKGRLVGPVAQRLEGRGEQFRVVNGIALDVITYLEERDGQKGFAPHLLPALIMVGDEDSPDGTEVELVGSSEREIRHLLERIRQDVPSVQLVDESALPSGATYPSRLELDERGRLIARGKGQERTDRAARSLKEAVTAGKLSLPNEPLESEDLHGPVKIRQRMRPNSLLRAVAKTIVNMVAFAYGKAPAQSDALRPLRRFALGLTDVGPVRLWPVDASDEANEVRHFIRMTAADRSLSVDVILYGCSGYRAESALPAGVALGPRVFVVLPGELSGPLERPPG